MPATVLHGRWKLSATLVATTLVVASSWLTSGAFAATTIGATPPPRGFEGDCNAGLVDGSVVQVSATDLSYEVPDGGGVITEWDHMAGSGTGQSLALRLFTRQPTTSFTAVTQTAMQTITPGVLNRFPVRIPVSGGELLGLRNGPDAGSSHTACVYISTDDSDDQIFRRAPAEATGTSAAYTELDPQLVNVSARVEPDADGDGFGDETQDECPNDAATQTAPCDRVAPQTTITRQPKEKTTKRKARFKFISSEAGSTFECSFDGSKFASCNSPTRKKLSVGTHVFQVRAIDIAGNVDQNPALVTWKIVKKHKGHHEHHRH